MLALFLIKFSMIIETIIYDMIKQMKFLHIFIQIIYTLLEYLSEIILETYSIYKMLF